MRSDTDITAAQKTPTRRPARLRNRLPRLRACAGPRPATSPAPGLAADSGIASPRTPGHLEKSVKYPTSATPVDPRLPKITLQSPSLHQEGSPAPAGLVSPLRSLHQPLPHQIHTARSPTARRSAASMLPKFRMPLSGSFSTTSRINSSSSVTHRPAPHLPWKARCSHLHLAKGRALLRPPRCLLPLRSRRRNRRSLRDRCHHEQQQISRPRNTGRRLQRGGRNLAMHLLGTTRRVINATLRLRTKSASRCQARKLASGNPGVSHPCPSPAIPLTSPSTIPRPFFSEDHTARAASLADYVTISRYPSSRVWTGVAPLIGPSSEMKQSWFSNLFSWTPAVNSTPLLFEFADDRTRCSLRSPPTTAPPPERNASAPRNLRDERSP